MFLLHRVSPNRKGKMKRGTYLNSLGCCCQDRLHSIRMRTHRKIISSPPLKSIPNCTMSPSLIGYNLDTMFGWLSRMWFKKVPDELPTSLTCHWPFTNKNSQCLRLTTFDLNPTGESEGAPGFATGTPSRSEYRPTRITELSDGRVRETGMKCSDGRVLRWISWWG